MELVLGMIVTGLVMTAVAGLLSAVAKGWQHSGDTQASSNHAVQTHARMQKIVKGARQLGAVRAGSLEGNLQAAGIMIWAGDDNGDDAVQFSELGLLVHEGGVGTPLGYLAFYDVAYPTSWSAAERQAADTPALADDEIYDDANIDTFRSLAHVRMTLQASNLVGVVFTLKDGVDVIRPSLDYQLKFEKADVVEVEHGTVSVRTPTTLPASQRGP